MKSTNTGGSLLTTERSGKEKEDCVQAALLVEGGSRRRREGERSEPSLAKMAGKDMRQRRREAQRQKENQATVRSIGEQVWKSEMGERGVSLKWQKTPQSESTDHRRAFLGLPTSPSSKHVIDPCIILFSLPTVREK